MSERKQAMAGATAPSFHHAEAGEARITVLADGYRSFPLPDGLVTNADRAAVNAALSEAGMAPDQMTIHFNPVLVRTGGRTVLVDTGNGPAAAAEAGATCGWLPRSMAEAGIAAGDVDRVFITHFHGDHINGLRDADGMPAFPEADIALSGAEWDFWTDEALLDHDTLKGAAQNVRRIFAGMEDRIVRLGDGDAVAPGLRIMATPGHTPGHSSLMLGSGADAVLIQADVTNHPALFVRNPGWHVAFDIDADRAEATRRRVLDMASRDAIRVQGFHYPFPAIARLEKDGARYSYLPE